MAEEFLADGVSEPPAARVLELAGAALRALGITDGVTHVEIELTSDGPRLIEVNGRMGGYVHALLRAALRTALSPARRSRNRLSRHGVRPLRNTPAEADATSAGVRGLEEVAALEEVWQVSVDAPAGCSLHGRTGTEAHLGTVHGPAAPGTSAGTGGGRAVPRPWAAAVRRTPQGRAQGAQLRGPPPRPPIRTRPPGDCG